MELPGSVSTIVETIRESGDVERVYGEAIERNGRTVVPVARVAYGFGGGFGEDDESETGNQDDETITGGGSGAGGGGGAAARPIGALEITDDQTRFVRFRARNRVLGVFALGVVAGWLLRRTRE